MDLQVYVIIPVVFLVSFLSYLFISKYLPHGKSFDEMLAEKKRMREEVLGYTRNASKADKGSKKKPKKEGKKQQRDPVKVTKEVEKEPSDNESEASDDSEIIEEPPTIPETLVLRKNAQKPQQVAAKKGKGGKTAGILVNKNEQPAVVKSTPTPVEEVAVNHFEETHPKDAVEIQRAAPEEKKQHHKKGKVVKETPPVSPKNQPVVAAPVKAVEEKVVRKKRNEVSSSAVVGGGFVSDDITPLVREISKADLTKNQIQMLIDFLLNKQADSLYTEPSDWTEGKADMVQKLKKQLQETEAKLRNEQDALVGTQQKLKEIRAEFNNEKVHSNAAMKNLLEQMQNGKLEVKNLQAEMQFLADKNNQEKQALTMSYKQLHAKYVQMQENLKNQETMPSVQQLESDNQLLHQELAKKNQQIIDLNSYVDESRQKEDHFKKLLSENDKKIAEREVLLRKNEDRCAIIENEMRQKVQEVAQRDNEILKLNADVSRAKELDKVVQRQTTDLEQLKKQLNEQQQSKHADESSKIEIRNLQNALDSSKKELESQHSIVNDFKKQVEDLKRQLSESKQLTNSKSSSGDSFLLTEKINELNANHTNVIGQKDKHIAELKKQIEALQKTETELAQQIDEQKTKNNDLRTKNWKLVEALNQTSQSSSSPVAKSTNHSSNLVNHSNNFELSNVKDLFVKYFPDVSITSSPNNTTNCDTEWLDAVLKNLKSQIVSNKSTSSSIANNVTNNHLNNCSDNFNNKPVNGDSNNSSSASSIVAENELVLQNAHLKQTVDEYKNIIDDTEKMLKNLESQVREQDQYWSKVVLMKDNEIEGLKSIAGKS